LTLVNINFPPHALLFFQGAIVFASLDLFEGESTYDQLMEFKETTPLNDKFLFFRMDTKIFLFNSGSYFHMQLLMTLSIVLKYILNKMCRLFPRWRIARYLGMKAYQEERGQLRKGTLRLFMESYLDITMCVFLSLISFY